MILQRSIHVIKSGKWDEFIALEKQIDVLFIRAGIPPRRRYQPLFGGSKFVQVVEREWESLAAMEAFKPNIADPELTQLHQQAWSMIEDSSTEIYKIL